MLLSYHSQFEHHILSGAKIFTLRRRPKRMPKPGETLYKYTGGYNATRRLISSQFKYTGHQNVRLIIWLHTSENTPTDSELKRREGAYNAVGRLGYDAFIKIWVDGRLLELNEVYNFTHYDGFVAGPIQFAMYWLGKKTRTGALMTMLHWTDFRF